MSRAMDPRSRDIQSLPGGPAVVIRCGCGQEESRAGDNSVAESMGWQRLGGQWLCPSCGGRCRMAASFWDPAKWSAPDEPIVFEGRGAAGA